MHKFLSINCHSFNCHSVDCIFDHLFLTYLRGYGLRSADEQLSLVLEGKADDGAAGQHGRRGHVPGHGEAAMKIAVKGEGGAPEY